jgi:hypothetical protein
VSTADPIAGLASATPRDDRVVAIDFVEARELEATWRTDGALRLFHQPLADGRPSLTLERHDAIGYRLFALGYGVYLVSGDGSSIRAAPPETLAAWRWQRFLIGQVLPFAALLHGVEVFHASGVVLGDRVVAVSGRSGAGKTSVGLNLVRRGASFFTDDVLAVTRSRGRLVCHPGAATASLRDAGLREAVDAGDDALGEVLGRGPAGVRIVLDRDERELPLGAIYFLDRPVEGDRATAADQARFTRLADPFLLLASTFNLVIRTPARLERQLDTCAQIARSTAMFRVTVPPATTAARVADAVGAHAEALLSA